MVNLLVVPVTCCWRAQGVEKVIHRVKEGEIKHVRELAKLVEEHDLLIIERGEKEQSYVVSCDQKFMEIVSCISFLKDLGFVVAPTFQERITKGG